MRRTGYAPRWRAITSHVEFPAHLRKRRARHAPRGHEWTASALNSAVNDRRSRRIAFFLESIAHLRPYSGASHASTKSGQVQLAAATLCLRSPPDPHRTMSRSGRARREGPLAANSWHQSLGLCLRRVSRSWRGRPP